MSHGMLNGKFVLEEIQQARNVPDQIPMMPPTVLAMRFISQAQKSNGSVGSGSYRCGAFGRLPA